MLMPSELFKFKVEETFKCPFYLADKPEWVDKLNKASDPIIERLEKTGKRKLKILKILQKNYLIHFIVSCYGNIQSLKQLQI